VTFALGIAFTDYNCANVDGKLPAQLSALETRVVTIVAVHAVEVNLRDCQNFVLICMNKILRRGLRGHLTQSIRTDLKNYVNKNILLQFLHFRRYFLVLIT